MNNRLTVTPEDISRALERVIDPVTGKGLTSSGRIQGLSVRSGGRVGFTIEAPPGAEEFYEKVRAAAEDAARASAGVTAVTAVLTAERAPPAKSAPGGHGQPRGPSKAQTGAETPLRASPHGVAGVRAIIAVASAKGGVGKSTIAANLACAFLTFGKTVGLLDADVYGPSLPTILGVGAVRPEIGPGKKLLPVRRHGLASMSIGYLVDTNQPMVLRGARASGAIGMLLDDVIWGDEEVPLDLLVIDLPPGTGDVQLTLAQRVALSGAIIVSTPQEMALADVRRGIAMFEQTHVPILGVIENMAYFELPNGERAPIFGEGGARRTAEQFAVPFLGEIPIDIGLRLSGDSGRPIVATAPEAAISKRFLTIAEAALANIAAGAKPAPTIRFV